LFLHREEKAMALVDTSIHNADNSIRFIYNVSSAVDSGQGQYLDVLLVQYFLGNIWANPTNFPVALPAMPAPLVLDGKYGPQTGSYILAFQSWLLGQGTNVVADGRVDHAQPGLTPIQQATYTIDLLNAFFTLARPDIPFDDIANHDPNCPSDLGNLFNSAASSAASSADSSADTERVVP
jgi:hypothetical protein